MSICIEIKFLAGKFHATPWNHQVNEGVVEWPPSPWRVLRALVAGYYKLENPPKRAEICQLLTYFTESYPSYVLPPVTAAHTRHYMPVWKEGKATTTKVFDTFLVVGEALSENEDEVVKIVWSDVSLNEEERQLLELLAGGVSYLGRAESWVELAVSEKVESAFNAVPAKLGDLSQEKVKVLVAMNSQQLEGFKATLAAIPKPKKAKWKIPNDLLDVLSLDIGELHSQGWNGIPGTCWVSYQLEDATSPPTPLLRGEGSNVARFALISKVPPKLTEAVSLGERFRQAIMSKSEEISGNAEMVFSGRDEEGNASRENHQHAWYLCEDADGDNKIDRLVVYCQKEFTAKAIQALQKVEKVWGSEGFDIKTLLIGLGRAESFGTVDGEDEPGKSAILGKGKKWRSLTPMVLPRFPKRNHQGEPKLDPKTGFQNDGVEQQAIRLLKQLQRIPDEGYFEDWRTYVKQRQLPLQRIPDEGYFEDGGDNWLCWIDSNGDVAVKVRKVEVGVREKLRWQDFQRRRYHGEGKKGPDQGFWLELEFGESQQGPIALGYAAHFGLGLFVPVP